MWVGQPSGSHGRERKSPLPQLAQLPHKSAVPVHLHGPYGSLTVSVAQGAPARPESSHSLLPPPHAALEDVLSVFRLSLTLVGHATRGEQWGSFLPDLSFTPLFPQAARSSPPTNGGPPVSGTVVRRAAHPSNNTPKQSACRTFRPTTAHNMKLMRSG